MPLTLTLFVRDECHLCDQALALLAHTRAPQFNSVFIDGDAGLEARYGARVPVLRDGHSGKELDWPFDPARLQAMYSSACPSGCARQSYPAGDCGRSRPLPRRL